MCQKYLYSYYIIFVYARKAVTLWRFKISNKNNKNMKKPFEKLNHCMILSLYFEKIIHK